MRRFVICLLSCGGLVMGVDTECSTQKVNPNCTVTFDRSYPVALPTIQMRKGAVLTVAISNPLPFERLMLELQSTQAIPPSDQTSAFVTGALPDLKGLIVRTTPSEKAHNLIKVNPPQYWTDYLNTRDMVFQRIMTFVDGSSYVYEQLNEVLGPLSPALLPQGTRVNPSAAMKYLPRPWRSEEFADWKSWMGCELAGIECEKFPQGAQRDAVPPTKDLLSEAAAIQALLAACPMTPDNTLLSCRAKNVIAGIAGLSTDLQKPYLDQLNSDAAVTALYGTAIGTMSKDLSTYAANIQRSVVVPPALAGSISDPYDASIGRNVKLEKALGRQTVYALNAVNEIATPSYTITGATQKKTIVSITVLYAEPRFEVSSGAFFSLLPNRSFANQTVVTQTPGSVPSTGNIFIQQTETRPTVIPFFAANWRLTHEHLWHDQRRGALYGTAAVALNPYNSLPEFAFGFSVSWRALMFSPLIHAGHDARLTQGETVGQVWCNSTAAVDSIPKCGGNPPAPSMERYWTPKFAIGISVRIPTVFGGK